MNSDNKNDKGMMWMGIAMVACCAIPITISLLAGGGLGFLASRSVNQPVSSPTTNQTAIKESSLDPAVNWQVDNHVHGLSVDVKNANIAYIASHRGLLQTSETGGFYWVQPQNERADYMGFTSDPTNSDRFYASGHPQSGGNLGFQITEDRAKTWQFVSMKGVDFHALAIAPSNPQIFYGYPASGAEGLHVSSDGGKTWTRQRADGLTAQPFNIVVDPVNSDRAFAITQSGLFETINRGDSWQILPSTTTKPIIGMALVKEGDRSVIYGYQLSQSKDGIYRSVDGGKSWQEWGTGTEGVILYLAVAPSNPQIFYAVNAKNTIFQSQNGGKTWKILT